MYADPRSSTSKVEVEAILVSMTDDALRVMMDESSRPMNVPRIGIKVIYSKEMSKHGAFVVLSMSERTAINTGLV